MPITDDKSGMSKSEKQPEPKPELKGEKPPPTKPGKATAADAKRTARKTQRSDPTLENGQEVIKHLEQLTPETLWKGTYKDAEINSRVAKGRTCLAELDTKALTSNSKDSDQYSKPIETLTALLDRIPKSHDLMKKIKASKNMVDLMQSDEILTELEETMLYFCERGSGEIMVAVLLFIGQKLSEANKTRPWAGPGRVGYMVESWKACNMLHVAMPEPHPATDTCNSFDFGTNRLSDCTGL